LESISYIDYLGFDPKTQPETRVLLSLVEIISAAKVDGNALAAADQVIDLFFIVLLFYYFIFILFCLFYFCSKRNFKKL